jgi:hypothetical protein
MGMVAWVFYFWVPTGDRVYLNFHEHVLLATTRFDKRYQSPPRPHAARRTDPTRHTHTELSTITTDSDAKP